MLPLRIAPEIVGKAPEAGERHAVVAIDAELYDRLFIRSAVAGVVPRDAEILAVDLRDVACLLKYETAIDPASKVRHVKGVDVVSLYLYRGGHHGQALSPRIRASGQCGQNEQGADHGQPSQARD